MNNKLALVVNFVAADKLSGALKNIIGLGKGGSNAIRALNGESRKLNAEMRGVQRELAKASGNVSHLIERERQLELQIAGTNDKLAKQKRLLAIEANQRSIRGRGDELKASGQDNLTGGAVMGAGIGLLAKGAMDFDAAMTDVGIKLGINAQLTRQLGLSVIDAADKSRQLPANMLLAADALASAGIQAGAIPPMLADIGKVALAANADLGDMAKASASNMLNLKVSANDTALALGVMHAAGKAGRFELKTMAQYFPALTARAAAFGQTGVAAVADLAAAAQVAARAVGGDGEQAATNLENLLAKINTEETRKKFGKMGVDLKAEMDKAMAQGMTPIEAITTITNKALGGKLDNLSLLFGDMQAQNALLPLIQNFEEFKRIRQQALDGAPQAMLDFARKSGDAKIQMQALMGAGQGAAITLGRELLPHLVTAAGHITKVVSSVAAWMRAHPQLTGAIAQGVIYLTAFKLGLGALQYGFGALLGPFARIYGLFARVDGISKFGLMLGRVANIGIKSAGLLARGFGVMRTAAMFLAKGFLRAGMMMLANPMVLVIMALVAAVGFAGYMIYTHWDKIKNAFSQGWANVKNLLSAAPAWLKGIGAAMMNGLLLMINPMALAAKLLEVARNGIAAFKNFFGIKSPSRLMMAMGGHINTGLASGIDGSARQPVRAARRMAAGVAAGTALALTPMAAAAPGRGGAGIGGQGDVITIKVYGAAGQSADDLAQAVMRKLERVKAAKARRSYEDQD